VNGSVSVSPTETTTYTITATGPAGTATDNVTIHVNDPSAPPTVTFDASPASIAQSESSTLSWTSNNGQDAHIDNAIGVVSLSGSTTVSPDHTTTYTITVTGPTGSASAQAVVTVLGSPEPQPEGSFGEPYEDLIPPDATVESYDPKLFSVITGLVQDLAGSPIADVSVTIHDHPEYGTVATDGDGRFSIPVEGGGTITVVYQKDGLLTVHRKVYVPWNDIPMAKTIVMIAEDPASTTVTFDGNPETVVTHQSTEVTDDFGSRSCTMVFTGDNMAYLVDEQGNDIHQLVTITTRATEYTTPESMPAILPPTSAFTYCVEFAVDGAPRVRFENPVITWVDNFLGFDVGMVVPVGFYDRDRGVWVPEKNGRVVKLLDTDSDGIVNALDADGDDQPDDLNENGSFGDEVTGLENAQKYQPETTYWMVALTHFTPGDLNWARSIIASLLPLVPHGPEGSIAPDPESEPIADQQEDERDDCQGHNNSFVEERSRIFHEDILIPGTDFALHYASNRVEGYRHGIVVPASGETVPDGLKRIIVNVEVAGRTFEQVLDPLPNQVAAFVWDGLDHLEREVIGFTDAHVAIGFVYDAVYTVPPELELAFAMVGEDLTSILTRQDVTLWKRSSIPISAIKEKRRGIIAEGWTLSSHHHLDPKEASVLHKGNGTITKNNAIIIETVAGNGTPDYSGDGGPAIEAQLFSSDVTVDASGNLYIADSGNHRIRKVDTSGIITTVAGNGTSGYSGDGGPATQAQLNYPWGVAVDASGNLYIIDSGNYRIRKVDTSGIITTVAGNGTGGYSGDGGPAIEAQLYGLRGIAVDASGNLYIADYNTQRVRKVDPSGIIETVAGNGTAGYSGDGGPATEAQLYRPWGLAVDASGNLYIGDRDNNRVRMVDLSGTITTLAGIGPSGLNNGGYSGDGGLAAEAELNGPNRLAVDASGNLYITDGYNKRIRKVDPSGIITTLAGNGTAGYSDDGEPATQAQLNYPVGVAVDPSGNVLIADNVNRRIRKVATPSAFIGAIASGDIPFAEENGLGHIMSSAGHHMTTIDLDTGVTLYAFGYNEDNQLITITGRFGNEIAIDRNASGVPTAITSPDGITTTLTIDANNQLTRIAYPDGSYYGFEYTTDGLLTAKIEPEGNRFEHVFNSIGRLTDAFDQEGGHWTYTRTAYENGDILTEVLTGEGNLTSYLDYTFSTDAYTSTITGPTGAETVFTRSADGLTVSKSLACGMELDFKYDVDPEYKFQYVKEMTESTPSVLEKVTLREKTYEDTNSDEIPDRIAEEVTVNSKTTTCENNVLQSRKTITSPEGRTLTTLYDSATLLTTSLTIPGLYETTYGYDSRGRLTSIDTNIRETTFVYDTQGFLGSITDPENHTTTYTYDAVGRMTGINRPDGTTAGFMYDQNGNMAVLTNPSTIDHGFGYSLVNLNSSYQTPLSGSYSYVYDKDRRLVQTNFPSGSQINNIYDKTRLIQIQTPEGNIDLSYLCRTKVGSISKGTESITYGYDGKLVTSETLSGTLNQSPSYGYNNDFIMNSFTYAGDTHMYTYDDDGLLTGAGGFAIFRNAANGLPESVTGGALNLSRTFNGYGEVDVQDFTISGGSITSWNLTRDDNGRITQKIETVNGDTSNYLYTYDPMGRLLTVTKDSTLVEEYQYGLNGTRTYEMNALRGISGRTFGYSDEDHLLTAGGTTYQYNVDGFLTTRTEGTDVTTYDYSSRGELLGVTLPDGTNIEYVHDPLGRRIAKLVNVAMVEKYLWQGLTRLLAVYDGSDNLIMRFDYADGRMPVAMTQDGFTYYLTHDQVGSLRVVADASGTAVKRIEYDSFGNVIDDTNPSFTIPFGFAGGLHDRDTGLVRFGFRDYDPDIGRWTAKDPIGFWGGDTYLYGYCLNNPINAIDPHGLIIGSFLSKGIGKIVRQTAQEAALSGKIADAAISAVLTFDTNNTIVPKVNNQVVADVLLGIQGWGTFQTASLAGLSAASAPAWLPVGLSGLAGLEIGGLLNELYERLSDQSLGEDIYDWLNPQQRQDSPCE
jgi:RHS repeat-associated protein